MYVGCGLDDSLLVVPFLAYAKDNSPLQSTPHPRLSVLWILGLLPPEVKRPGYESDYSPLSSTEVKIE
jgi:hypothetical protein